MNNKKLVILFLVIVMLFLYSFPGKKGDLVENLNVPIAVGCDLKGSTKDNFYYNIPISIYIFEESGDVTSDIFMGSAKSIGETRNDRQARSNKKFLLGLERVFILGESFAQYGIRNLIDILTNNPQNNDTPYMVVYNGNAEDILRLKVKGYPSSGEFIDGLIKNAKQFNFFSERYTIMNVIKSIDSEGKTLLLPYIDMKDNSIQISGLAIFKKDKMVAKTTLDESRLIHLLKETKVRGIVTLQDSAKKYINFYGESKRKVKCTKDGDKFKFTIDLKLTGSIVSNELYKDLYKDEKVLKKFTTDMEEKLTKECTDYIHKIQSQYQIDILDLGMVAVAKHGRQTGVDWDKIISNSDIEVKVHVKVDTEGRGDY